MKLGLNDVTVCAADCSTPSLAALALKRSLAQCSFGDAVLFTDGTMQSDEFRTVRIEPLNSRDEYSRFVLQELVHSIRTPYALVIQWDGYVLEPRAWTPDFLRYDWIGAKWPFHKDGMTVGNGGFSLRSRKLMEITASPVFQLQPGVNEDELVCRTYRTGLERDFQIRFAPEEIADRFSYENSIPNAPTFGFHALFNMWRHVDDEDMVGLSEEFTPQILRSGAFIMLLDNYVRMRRFRPLMALYSRWKLECTLQEIRSQILAASRNQEFTDTFVGFCEALGPFT
jgi:hypothetical protein